MVFFSTYNAKQSLKYDCVFEKVTYRKQSEMNEFLLLPVTKTTVSKFATSSACLYVTSLIQQESATVVSAISWGILYIGDCFESLENLTGFVCDVSKCEEVDSPQTHHHSSLTMWVDPQNWTYICRWKNAWFGGNKCITM